MVRSTLFCLLISPAIVAPAFAQGAAAAHVRPTWFEAGGGAGAAVAIGEGGGAFPTLQARVNLLPAAAVELTTHWPVGDTERFYDLHGRFTVHPSQRLSTYATVGGLGEFQRHHVREYRSPLPTGDVIVYPAHTYSNITPPIALTVGGGARVQLANHVSLDAGAEGWVFRRGVAVAMRGAIMVSFGPRR